MTFDEAYDALLARWPLPVEPVDVPSGYGTTRVHVCGPVDGPPLVLLSQYGATSTVWFANVGDLGAAYRLYAVDPIGQPGRSVTGSVPLDSQAKLMDWLDGLLTGLGLDRASLCGHSYGAWLALSYAVHAPDRVRRLALLDPTDCFAGLRLSYRLRAVPLLTRPSPDRWDAFVGWETRGAAPPDPDWARLAKLASTSRPRFVVPRRPRAAGLRVPTLVALAQMSRAHDIARVEASARRLLPEVTTVVLPGVAHHSLPTAHADRLDRELLAFGL